MGNGYHVDLSPLWARTALILNYDENDGLFDHVAPPTPEPGTPGEFVGGQPIAASAFASRARSSRPSRGGAMSAAGCSTTPRP